MPEPTDPSDAKTVRFDDTTSAIAKQVYDLLDDLTPSVELRLEGLEYQGSTSLDWAYLVVDMTSQSDKGPDAYGDGSATIEVYTRPRSDDLYRHQEIMEKLRGGLQNLTLAVYGKASGAPSTLRGHILFKEVDLGIVGASEGLLIGTVTATWRQRG